MSNNYFSFKHFTVEQENASMRVNTDGVLLGAWCTIPNSEGAKILDVGCGTGVIALMASQRLSSLGINSYSVDGVEIDSHSAVLSVNNFRNSEWKKHLKVFNVDFQSMAENPDQRYNLLVSNPPYFINSLKNPSQKKKTARHTDSLSYADLIEGAVRVLEAAGILAVILPPEESSVFESIAEKKNLFLNRRCRVFSKAGEPAPKRVMMEFEFSPKEVSLSAYKKAEVFSEDLCIMDENLEYTSGYIFLAKDFYLKF